MAIGKYGTASAVRTDATLAIRYVPLQMHKGEQHCSGTWFDEELGRSFY